MSMLLERQFYLRQELDERKYKATADRNIIIIKFPPHLVYA